MCVAVRTPRVVFLYINASFFQWPSLLVALFGYLVSLLQYVEFNCCITETRKSILPEIEANALRVSEVLDLLKRSSLRIDATTKTLFVELSQGLAALRCSTNLKPKTLSHRNRLWPHPKIT